jgi:hypothetical protein
MKGKKKSAVQKAQRRRAGAMLKTFQAQVFESKRDKARRKTRLRKSQDPREGW